VLVETHTIAGSNHGQGRHHSLGRKLNCLVGKIAIPQPGMAEA